MSNLTERELSALLHRAVPDPEDPPGRAQAVRRRVRRLRRRRAAVGSTALAAAVAVVAVPTLVTGSHRDSPGPAAAPSTRASGPSAPPSGCGSVGVCASGIPDRLRRPLRLPSVAAGASCPVSRAHRIREGQGFSGPFQAYGPGPFYLTQSAHVRFDPSARSAQPHDAGWTDAKVIWGVRDSYRGPLLVRGAQIDGNHPLGFDHYLGAVGYSGSGPGDDKPYPELGYPRVRGTVSTVRTYPSGMWFQAPGCYAIQVDGLGFSEKIVFRAEKRA